MSIALQYSPCFEYYKYLQWKPNSKKNVSILGNRITPHGFCVQLNPYSAWILNIKNTGQKDSHTATDEIFVDVIKRNISYLWVIKITCLLRIIISAHMENLITWVMQTLI